MAINVESQAVIDEAIDRATVRIKEIVATTLGELGKDAAAMIVALRSEREAFQNWAEGLEVTIGPKTIPAFKITLRRNK
jgi:DNA uptake protein ComE-like DNA-binding protein